MKDYKLIEEDYGKKVFQKTQKTPAGTITKRVVQRKATGKKRRYTYISPPTGRSYSLTYYKKKRK